jgi:hypothetical protein
MKNMNLSMVVAPLKRFNPVKWLMLMLIVLNVVVFYVVFAHALREVGDREIAYEPKCVRNRAAERIRNGGSIRTKTLEKYREQCANELAEQDVRALRAERAEMLSGQQ